MLSIPVWVCRTETLAKHRSSAKQKRTIFRRFVELQSSGSTVPLSKDNVFTQNSEFMLVMNSHNSCKIFAGLSNFSLVENIQSNISLRKTRFVLTGLKDSSVFQGMVLYFIFKNEEQSPQAESERSANSYLRGFLNSFMPCTLTQTRMKKGLFLLPSISNSSRWQSCTSSDSLLPALQRDNLFTLGTSFRHSEVRSPADISLLTCISQRSIWETENWYKNRRKPMANMAHNPVGVLEIIFKIKRKKSLSLYLSIKQFA